MISTKTARTVGGSAVATLGLAAACLMMSGTAGLAQSENSGSRKGLVGTWFVQVTLRNCVSNAPLGSFASLVTYHRGGTLSESTSSPAFAIGQRNPGTGNWEFDGHHEYSQRMIALINFNTPANLPGTPGFNPALPVSPGFFAGWQTVSHTVVPIDADHATSSGTNDFYRADGTLYRTGCSTAVSSRFE